ncbi:hypothetical protein EBB07_03690 [Paenibacillaceae bacterium]|nr:hypothetical protein EBB07_03690 [Paenibacillaceae bacterium]
MNREYRRMAWGMLFVLIDFRINGFDIVPDWIGYAMISFGCAQLVAGGNKPFRLAQYTALLLFCFAVVNVFTGTFVVWNSNQDIRPEFGFPMLFNGASGVLDLVLVFLLCAGIYKQAMAVGSEEFAQSAQRCGYIYLIVNGAIDALLPFTFNLSDNFTLIVIMLSFVSLLTKILVTLLLFRASKPFYMPPPSEDSAHAGAIIDKRV